MKWLILTLVSLSATAQAQSVTDYQCNKNARTTDAVMNSACYIDVTTKAVSAAHARAGGRAIKPCFTTTAPGTPSASAEKNMKRLYGNYPVEFVDYYVNTTQFNEPTEKFEPQFTSFVVKVETMSIRTIDGTTFCQVKPSVQIVYPK